MAPRPELILYSELSAISKLNPTNMTDTEKQKHALRIAEIEALAANLKVSIPQFGPLLDKLKNIFTGSKTKSALDTTTKTGTGVGVGTTISNVANKVIPSSFTAQPNPLMIPFNIANTLSTAYIFGYMMILGQRKAYNEVWPSIQAGSLDITKAVKDAIEFATSFKIPPGIGLDMIPGFSEFFGSDQKEIIGPPSQNPVDSSHKQENTVVAVSDKLETRVTPGGPSTQKQIRDGILNRTAEIFNLEKLIEKNTFLCNQGNQGACRALSDYRSSLKQAKLALIDLQNQLRGN